MISHLARVTVASQKAGDGQTGCLAFTVDGEERTVVYASVHKWCLAAGVHQSYVNNMEQRQAKRLMSGLYWIVFAITIGVLLIAAINFMGRIVAMRSNRQLEEKADSDLLTGLEISLHRNAGSRNTWRIILIRWQSCSYWILIISRRSMIRWGMPSVMRYYGNWEDRSE